MRLERSLPARLILVAASGVFLGSCGHESGTGPTPVSGPASRTETTTASQTGFAQAESGSCVALGNPKPGATLDNGRTDLGNRLVWNFSWSPCVGAGVYQIYVRHRGSAAPTVTRRVVVGSYQYACDCYVSNDNLDDWYWKVRARVGTHWGPWTAERPFKVEPVNTDP